MNNATGFENGDRSATGFCNELGGSYSHGLTKRELIAAMCLQSIIGQGYSELNHAEVAAQRSIVFADALLKEIEKPN